MPPEIAPINSAYPAGDKVTDTVIRNADSDDLHQIMSIVDKWPTHFVDAAKPMIEGDFHNHKTFMAEVDREAVGFLIYSCTSEEIEVLWMAVSPNHKRKGIGTTLLRRVLDTLTTQRRVYLKTSTTDSVIPGTQFSGPAFEETTKFFQSLGFVQDTVHRKYWGDQNHCAVMVRMLRNNDPRNDLLAIIAPMIRPLQKELGKAFGIRNAYVGIAFRQKNCEACTLFAEYVPSRDGLPTEGDEYARDEYTFNESLAFVAAIINSSEQHVVYNLESPGHKEIDGEIRTRWGEVESVVISRFPLNYSDDVDSQGNVVVYTVTQKSLPKAKPNLVKASVSLVSQVLRSALFLVESQWQFEKTELSVLARDLARLIPEYFPEHETRFRSALDELRHPVRWYSRQFEHFGPPEISSSNQLSFSSDQMELFRSIRDAHKITITGQAEGGLQGRQIFFAKMLGRDTSGNPTVEYTAVLKSVQREAAQRELAGYLLAQRFFSKIGFALPPPATHWNPVDSERCISVIPWVEGETLAKFTQTLWGTSPIDRAKNVEKLRTIIKELKRFVEGFKRSVVPSEELLRDSVVKAWTTTGMPGESGRAVTQDALATLEPVATSKLLNQQGVKYVNPLWFVKALDEHSWSAESEASISLVDYCHNDLHFGNVLYEPKKAQLVIIDFERAGPGPEWGDHAWVEISFLLAVASNSRFHSESEWTNVFPQTLKALAEQEKQRFSRVPDGLIHGTEAFDLWLVCQEVREELTQSDVVQYRHRLASCLIKLLRGQYRVHREKGGFSISQPAMFGTLVVYTGLILKQLICVDPAENASEFCFFPKT